MAKRIPWNESVVVTEVRTNTRTQEVKLSEPHTIPVRFVDGGEYLEGKVEGWVPGMKTVRWRRRTYSTFTEFQLVTRGVARLMVPYSLRRGVTKGWCHHEFRTVRNADGQYLREFQMELSSGIVNCLAENDKKAQQTADINQERVARDSYRYESVHEFEVDRNLMIGKMYTCNTEEEMLGVAREVWRLTWELEKSLRLAAIRWPADTTLPTLESDGAVLMASIQVEESMQSEPTLYYIKRNLMDRPS